MSETQLHIFKNLLRELAELAEHASLTGAMSGGEKSAVRRYNQALATLQDEGVVPRGLFAELPADTQYGELAVECKLLLASIKGDDDESDWKSKGKRKRREGDFDYHVLMGLAPFTRGEDLAKLVENEIKKGARVPGHVLVALAPFLPGDMITKLVSARLNQVSDHDEEEPQNETEPEEKDDDVSQEERHAATTELAQYLEGEDAIDHIMGDPDLPAEAKLELIRKALESRKD